MPSGRAPGGRPFRSESHALDNLSRLNARSGDSGLERRDTGRLARKGAGPDAEKRPPGGASMRQGLQTFTWTMLQ